MNEGCLDVVCGFMLVDEDSRTIVLEGLGGMGAGLTTLVEKIGRAGPNGRAYRALVNPQVRFAQRIYSSFDADLKKVRAREGAGSVCYHISPDGTTSRSSKFDDYELFKSSCDEGKTIVDHVIFHQD